MAPQMLGIVYAAVLPIYYRDLFPLRISFLQVSSDAWPIEAFCPFRTNST